MQDQNPSKSNRAGSQSPPPKPLAVSNAKGFVTNHNATLNPNEPLHNGMKRSESPTFVGKSPKRLKQADPVPDNDQCSVATFVDSSCRNAKDNHLDQATAIHSPSSESFLSNSPKEVAVSEKRSSPTLFAKNTKQLKQSDSVSCNDQCRVPVFDSHCTNANDNHLVKQTTVKSHFIESVLNNSSKEVPTPDSEKCDSRTLEKQPKQSEQASPVSHNDQYSVSPIVDKVCKNAKENHLVQTHNVESFLTNSSKEVPSRDSEKCNSRTFVEKNPKQSKQADPVSSNDQISVSSFVESSRTNVKDNHQVPTTTVQSHTHCIESFLNNSSKEIPKTDSDKSNFDRQQSNQSIWDVGSSAEKGLNFGLWPKLSFNSSSSLAWNLNGKEENSSPASFSKADEKINDHYKTHVTNCQRSVSPVQKYPSDIKSALSTNARNNNYLQSERELCSEVKRPISPSSSYLSNQSTPSKHLSPSTNHTHLSSSSPLHYREIPTRNNSLTSLSQLSQSVGGTINNCKERESKSRSSNSRSTPSSSTALSTPPNPPKPSASSSLPHTKTSWSTRFAPISMPTLPRLNCFLSLVLP